MFEYIIDVGLKPAIPYTKRRKTDMIVLHHAAGETGVQAMHKYHISKRGYRGIAYNIFIDLDGKAYWGRGIEYVGGGVQDSGVTAGINQRCVAIVCNGNFEQRTMPDAQKEALLRVIGDLLAYYPAITKIAGHKEVAAPGHTVCPGKNFPLAEAKLVKAPTKPPAASKPPATAPKYTLKRVLRYNPNFLMRGDDVEELQRALKAAGFNPGIIDGILGKRTWQAVIAFQRKHKLIPDGIVGEKTASALGWKFIAK